MKKNGVLLSAFTALLVMAGLTSGAQNLVITEISYNPPESGSDSLEFVEIYNNGTTAVNLNGYNFTQGFNYTFPSVMLNANDYILVAVDSMAMWNSFGVSAYQWTSGGLSNSGEDITLVTNTGVTVDSVDYDDGSPWPTSADGGGYSLVRCDLTLDPNLGTSWSQSGTMVSGLIINSNQVYASPGAVDGACSANPPTPTIPSYTVSQVTGNDANGVADSLAVDCKLTLVLYSIDFDGNSGYSLFGYDATGGINVFSFSDVSSYTSPMPGDSIRVIGSIAQFNGLTEIIPDSIVVLGTGVNVQAPTVRTTMDESTESEYSRLNGFSLVTPSQWPTSTGSSNVDITNGTDTVIMRIDSDTDIDGTPAPIGSFDVIGAGSQFDNSSPYDEGYQILPSSLNDIIVAAPANPTANFNIGSVTAIESAGTITVELNINPPSTTQDTITLQLTPGVGIGPGDGTITPIPSLTTGLFDLIIPANEDSTGFTAQIIDDALVESNETLFVDMVAVSSGLLMGNNDDFELIIIDNDAPAPGIPHYDIAQVTTDDANGVVDSLNVECKLTGIVYTDDYDGNNGYSFYIYDATGGINVFSFNDIGSFVVTRGDSIRVIGQIQQFNGLTELVPDSIVVLGSGITLNPPAVVSTLDATTEGEYIRLNGYSLVTPSQWPAAGSSANVDITDGVQTLTMRIDSDTDIDGTTAPTGTFDVIGAGGQFDSSNPFTSGYQILPRDTFDIIPSVPLTPTINFPAGSQQQLESAGTITVTLPISPVSSSMETVDVYVSNGAGATSADYTTTPAAVNDTISLTIPANAASVSFDIDIVNDAIQESNEDITFTLVNPSAGLTIGLINPHVFTIQDDDTPIPTYQISDIDGVDAQGIADSLNVYCRVNGVVTISNLQATRLDFYFTDISNNAGIKVFMNGLGTYNPIPGDELRVVGTIGQFNGQIQLIPDSMTVVSTGNVIAPTVVTTLDETTEGRILRLNDVELVDTTGWPTANFGNFDLLLPNGQVFTLRIDSDIPALWPSAPVGKFDVIGLGGQYDNAGGNQTPPYDSLYQILPRKIEDIIVILPKLAITEVMPSSNHSGAIGGDWFEVTNFGNDPVDMNGFSWDDDSQQSGKHLINSTYTIAAGEAVIFFQGLTADVPAWLQSWTQAINGLRVIAEDDFGPIGFSGLSSGGDEVNLYDDKGQRVSQAAWTANDVTAGVSIQFDTTGTLTGPSQLGVDGAYNSNDGDLGNPGNMNPVSLSEFFLKNIDVYPNPTSGLVYLQTEIAQDKKIEITALDGRLIRTINSEERLVEIDLNDLPAGIYIFTVELDGARASRKLIVE